MDQDIRVFKLVTGEVVIGIYDETKNVLCETATIQSIPAQQGGMQMVIAPYGIPFENTLCATIEGKHFLYNYSGIPQELKNKYLEVAANIAKNGSFGKLQFGKPNTENNAAK